MIDGRPQTGKRNSLECEFLKRIFPITITGWLILMSTNLFAQSIPANSLFSSYSKGINMDIWQAGLLYNYNSNGRVIIFRDNLMTSMLSIPSMKNRWKDKHQAGLSLIQTLNGPWSLTADGGSFLFSDRHTGYNNDIKSNYLKIGSRYKKNGISIPVSGGIKSDQRLGRKDNGLTYNIGFEMEQLQIGDYSHQFNAGHQADYLNKRKNSGLTATYRVHRKFQNNSGDTLTAGINNQRRDYYVSSQGTIESRDERSHYAENRLTYIISPELKYRIKTAVYWRQLDINLIEDETKQLKRKRNDFSSDLGFSLYYQKPFFSGTIELSRVSEDQKYNLGKSKDSSPFSGSHLLDTPDNISKDTRLNLQAGWHWSVSDSLHITSSIHKFQYDTPAENNFDDRDEMRIKVNIQNFHNISPGLDCIVSLSTHLLHFVYIYGRRSADNNWTRILRFQPELHWRPSDKVSIHQSAEILANYVSYDFEALFPTVKSFLYRKFTLSDTLDYSFSETCRINFNYRLELDENGKFLIDNWSEQRLIDRNSHTLGFTLTLRPSNNLVLSPGYRYYTRKGFQYMSSVNSSEERNLSQYFRSYGPYFMLRYTGHKLHVTFTASRMNTETLRGGNQILARVNLNCRMLF